MFDEETKLEHVKNNLVSDLDSTCTCQLTSGLELFYFNQFLCVTSHPHVIAFSGRVFETDTCKNADIMKCLETQVKAEFEHSVEGVSLKALDYCSVYLDEGTTPSCDITTTEAVMGEESTSSTTPYIASMAVIGLLALILLVVCIITIVYFRRKFHSKKIE